MQKKSPFVLCLAVLIMAACGEETRNGELKLAGANPVRLVDEGGKTVEFPAGPTTVEISAGSGGKFTVVVSQGKDKKAKFSGKASSHDDSWNFTVRGKDIGQPEDMTSARKIDYYGNTWRQMRDGGPCGMGGTWLVEEEYQKCNEDWKVAFNDAGSGQAVGAFESHRDGQDCRLSSRDLFCRGERPIQPYPRRFDNADESVKKLDQLKETGVNFD